MKKVLLLAVSITVYLVGSLTAEESLEKQFEARYQAWKEYCYELRMTSHASSHFTCDEFKEIVDLGLPALPYIAKKMQQNPNGTLLWKAIEVIAKVKIRGEYDRNTNKIVFPQFPNLKPNEDVYLYWWREGHKLTQDRFNRLYLKWKQRMESNNVEAEKTYQKMMDLGIPVIPYMMREIEKGESGLVPAVSYLTDAEISEDASPVECIQWWNSNREKWTIKFNDSDANENQE